MADPALAAIDCGTNTLRLLIVSGGRQLVREERLVRLGQGVAATGRFAPQALARVGAVLDEFGELTRAHDVRRVRFAATSAARDVTDRSPLNDLVAAHWPIEVEVLTGEQEAALSFAGAVASAPVAGPVAVTDIGGGSTEIIIGDTSGAISSACSLDVGAVRLRETFLHHDPPLPEEIAAARRAVDGLLAGVPEPPVGAAWLGVAGTFTTLAALDLELDRYAAAAVTDHVLAPRRIRRWADHCLTSSVVELTGPLIPAARAEVIAGGAIILAALADRFDRPVCVRDADLLDGLVSTLGCA